MRNEDEKEMILFIKTHEFIKKEALYTQLRKTGVDLPMKKIHTMVITKFNKLVCVDIAARFLIIIQSWIKCYLFFNSAFRKPIIVMTWKDFSSLWQGK